MPVIRSGKKKKKKTRSNISGEKFRKRERTTVEKNKNNFFPGIHIRNRSISEKCSVISYFEDENVFFANSFLPRFSFTVNLHLMFQTRAGSFSHFFFTFLSRKKLEMKKVDKSRGGIISVPPYFI
jgi:hypothetical protein